MKKKSFLIFLNKEKKELIKAVGKNVFWFLVGTILGLVFFLSFIFIFFQRTYLNVIYPGVTINGQNFGGGTKEDVKIFFAKKNEKIGEIKFVFKSNSETSEVSAKELNFGYDENLLAEQAYSVGRSKDLISNVSIILQAYINTINLPPSYHYSEKALTTAILPIMEKINTSPTEALFNFQDGKVSAFRLSKDGQEIDMKTLKNELMGKGLMTIFSNQKKITINIPIKVLKPKITTDKANNLGVKELIGTGTSLFQHSILNRIYNITLATTRLNGILIAPNETFSFNDALGDISAFTGYQQAYIIQNGKTVLGDGGGVCQVSTTLFRAILNAGLPVVERRAHAYRVGYYEQDSPPGFDSTVYSPSVDLKFKNDTGNYILIQTLINPDLQKLTFMLYGTKDQREVSISQAVITSQTPPKETVYQDDPTLPKGVEKQIDFAAPGANVYFTRTVKKNGEIIISDKFTSIYNPWAAVYLRGTKE